MRKKKQKNATTEKTQNLETTLKYLSTTLEILLYHFSFFYFSGIEVSKFMVKVLMSLLLVQKMITI